MLTYIALLRGINVAGKNKILMADLRASIEKIKLHDIKTYIQSGNIIFKDSRYSIVQLEEKIHSQIQKDFGFDVPVWVKSADACIQLKNPFLKNNGIEINELYITFLKNLPSAVSLKTLSTIESGKDTFIHQQSEIFLHCPLGYSRTKLSNTFLEKKLDVEATTRNWRTFLKLCALSKI